MSTLIYKYYKERTTMKHLYLLTCLFFVFMTKALTGMLPLESAVPQHGLSNQPGICIKDNELGEAAHFANFEKFKEVAEQNSPGSFSQFGVNWAFRQAAEYNSLDILTYMVNRNDYFYIETEGVDQALLYSIGHVGVHNKPSRMEIIDLIADDPRVQCVSQKGANVAFKRCFEYQGEKADKIFRAKWLLGKDRIPKPDQSTLTGLFHKYLLSNDRPILEWMLSIIDDIQNSVDSIFIDLAARGEHEKIQNILVLYRNYGLTVSHPGMQKAYEEVTSIAPKYAYLFRNQAGVPNREEIVEIIKQLQLVEPIATVEQIETIKNVDSYA